MERWRAVAALSILGFSGKDLTWIYEHGGPENLFLRNRPALVEKILESRKRNLPSIDEALNSACDLQGFIDEGGIIAGADSNQTLGKLRRAPNPPLCAFVRGQLADLDLPSTIAIVGSRTPTRRGMDRCEEIASYVVSLGCTIVSGGATGIDSVAHQAALSVGKRTVVVLGDPLKKQGDERSFRIKSMGPAELITMLSPYGPWITPAAFLFAARNQYVAALADAVIVVEGLAKSGTLHTAQFANRIGVPVWVIPGDLQDPFAGAANVLLEAGTARALVNFETFKKSMGLTKSTKPINRKPSQDILPPANISGGQGVVEVLRRLGGRATYDELFANSDCDMAAIQSDLSYLEIIGVVHKMGAQLVLTGN